jgi:hypothetical protein
MYDDVEVLIEDDGNGKVKEGEDDFYVAGG